MIQRVLWVVMGLVAFVATSALLHTLFPPPLPEGVAGKLRFFDEHKSEFDTLFIGTSRFNYAVSPEIFDRTTRQNGFPTRTFNFGVAGMHPPENFYVIDRILETKPPNLKWVFLETDNIQATWRTQDRGTQRLLYWHDWPRTALTIRRTLDPRGKAMAYEKVVRFFLRSRELALHMTLFGKRFTNVGRAADWFSSRDYSHDEVELGPKRDGYRLAGSAMSLEHAARFQEQLTRQTAGARPRLIDPHAEVAYRDCAARIRQIGAVPIFVVTPVIWQSQFRFRQSPPGPFLSFNNSRAYPQLYETKIRIDEGHLTREGAEEFTRLLAQEFLRRVRPL